MMFPVLFLLAAAETIAPRSEAVPFRQPQLASAHGQVAMAFGAGASIFFASSQDQGRSFGAPVKVAETGALALGRHRGPRLVILKDAMLISAIAGEKQATGPHAHGLPENGNLTVWRSTDKGATWARSSGINDVPGAAREGLHALAAGPGGKLFAVWWICGPKARNCSARIRATAVSRGQRTSPSILHPAERSASVATPRFRSTRRAAYT